MGGWWVGVGADLVHSGDRRLIASVPPQTPGRRRTHRAVAVTASWSVISVLQSRRLSSFAVAAMRTSPTPSGPAARPGCEPGSERPGGSPGSKPGRRSRSRAPMWILPGERAQSRSDWAGTVCDLVLTRRPCRVSRRPLSCASSPPGPGVPGGGRVPAGGCRVAAGVRAAGDARRQAGARPRRCRGGSNLCRSPVPRGAGRIEPADRVQTSTHPRAPTRARLLTRAPRSGRCSWVNLRPSSRSPAQVLATPSQRLVGGTQCVRRFRGCRRADDVAFRVSGPRSGRPAFPIVGCIRSCARGGRSGRSRWGSRWEPRARGW
jgi:hypothetical protein